MSHFKQTQVQTRSKHNGRQIDPHAWHKMSASSPEHASHAMFQTRIKADSNNSGNSATAATRQATWGPSALASTLHGRYQNRGKAVTVLCSVSRSSTNDTQQTPAQCSAPTFHVPYGMELSAYPSLEGINVLITGGARGLGMYSARLLAHLGACVYLADKDVAALAAAVDMIRKEVPGAQVVACPQLDLGKQASVHAFVDWWQAGGQALHVLVNNAGANFMGVEPWYTEQGVAGLPQVNYLGPYTLTRRLSSCLEAAARSSGRRSRIVNLCSVMHRHATLPDDPQFFLKDWWKGGSYRNCKLALTMTTSLLQSRLQDRSVDCVSVDPGAVYSGIWSTSRLLGKPPGSTVIQALFSTPEDACATTVHAAAALEVVPGGYYARGIFADDAIVQATYEPWAGVLSCLDWPLRKASSGKWAGELKAVQVAPYATQLGPAEGIWDACADLAGLPRGP